MKKFFAPLWVFVGGNLLLLAVSLFLPAVDTVQATLASDTAAIADNFWGWSWLMTNGVVRWLIYLTIEGLTLYTTARVFMSQRG